MTPSTASGVDRTLLRLEIESPGEPEPADGRRVDLGKRAVMRLAEGAAVGRPVPAVGRRRRVRDRRSMVGAAIASPQAQPTANANAPTGADQSCAGSIDCASPPSGSTPSQPRSLGERSPAVLDPAGSEYRRRRTQSIAEEHPLRFLSDADLATLRAADEATTSLPLPTQMISNGEYTPLPQTEAQREVEARIESYAETLAPQHGMRRREFLASSAGLAAAFLAMNEVFGPVFTASRAEAATPGACGRARAALGIPVHRRLPDALRARRLQPADADHGRAFREEALEPGPPGRRRPHALQVPELREGDLPRQRHQGRDDLRARRPTRPSDCS